MYECVGGCGQVCVGVGVYVCSVSVCGYVGGLWILLPSHPFHGVPDLLCIQCAVTDKHDVALLLKCADFATAMGCSCITHLSSCAMPEYPQTVCCLLG